jgi:mannitol-1-/sugar-/sorbitol-6-phosphatase
MILRRKSNQDVSEEAPPQLTISCSALLFDLDGVLIDSTPAVERVWRRWATERGFDPSVVVAHAHGRPSIATILHFLPKSDHELENRAVERREIDDVEGIVVLPGALELLNSLPLDRWTIATSCTRSLAEVRMRAAGLPIPERMVTSTDVAIGKPHPEPFLKAASKLGLPASDCVAIEDVPAGVRAGKAAGARVIALRTTVEGEELRAAGADFILNTCCDISARQNSNGLTLHLRNTNV